MCFSISDHMITFCKQIKLIAGRFPGIWRLDNGTEFTKFIKWAEKEGMKFEFTPPYTAEPNGIIERTGGYVNEMARVMILDAALPEKLWPHAVDAAIYTINRLASPKTGKSPIQVWRENLNIINAKPSLTHLRPWGSKAYAHIPKAKRVQSEKMAARAIEVRIMGYVGDHGHQFKVWDPETGRIHTTRDVGFPQYGDDEGNGNGTAADTSPKKPIEPSGGGGGGSAVSNPPDLDEEVKKPRNPIKQVVRLPQQAPLITPSPQGPPTGSAWTVDTQIETARDEIPSQRRQIGGEPYAWKPKRGPFQRRPPHGPRASILPPKQPLQPVLPSIAETPSTPARLQPWPRAVSPAILIQQHTEDAQKSLERAQEVAQQMAKKKSFEMKLKEINENLSRMSADTENARNASESIEPATESSSAAPGTTPTPAPHRQSQKHPPGLPIPRAHGEYKYPFEYEPYS
jgi:hypothetical protein